MSFFIKEVLSIPQKIIDEKKSPVINTTMLLK